MTHAPKFWENKLPQDKRGEFWGLIELGFGGETAYCRVLHVGEKVRALLTELGE